jgi:hypothetical protein
MAGFAKCRYRPLILLPKQLQQILAGQTRNNCVKSLRTDAQ